MLRPLHRKKAKKSPITDNPLRNPGQSLDALLRNTLDEQVLPLLLAITMCFFGAFCDWYRWFLKIPNHRPDLENVFYAALTSYCIFRIYTICRKTKNIKLARDGEKAVGQYLETLRAKGYCVFHDIIGNNFNIDHVIVGPQGIFTIETKTYSKPAQGKADIYFDGTSISANGYKPDRNPIVQALAQSRWLSEQIQSSAGRTHSVKPVVVFPGWFVTSKAEARSSNVWVLNPKALDKFIDREPVKLEVEEIKLIAYHLSRYIRVNYNPLH